MEEKPKIYTGLEGAAQWQLAAKNLHQISDEEYVVKMEHSAVCDNCDRKFPKLFKFIQYGEVVLFICHACVAELKTHGVLDFLHQKTKLNIG